MHTTLFCLLQLLHSHEPADSLAIAVQRWFYLASDPPSPLSFFQCFRDKSSSITTVYLSLPLHTPHELYPSPRPRCTGTYSHQWGTSPIVGVVQGLMGLHQTAPGWATFTVKPKLGDLEHGSITVPTLRGYINVTAKPGAVEVGVPCNTMATLCLPRSAQDRVLYTPQSHQLVLDGTAVPAVASGGHLCASDPFSCGSGGNVRRLTASLRS